MIVFKIIDKLILHNYHEPKPKRKRTKIDLYEYTKR